MLTYLYWRTAYVILFPSWSFHSLPCTENNSFLLLLFPPINPILRLSSVYFRWKASTVLSKRDFWNMLALVSIKHSFLLSNLPWFCAALIEIAQSVQHYVCSHGWHFWVAVFPLEFFFFVLNTSKKHSNKVQLHYASVFMVKCGQWCEV